MGVLHGGLRWALLAGHRAASKSSKEAIAKRGKGSQHSCSAKGIFLLFFLSLHAATPTLGDDRGPCLGRQRWGKGLWEGLAQNSIARLDGFFLASPERGRKEG